MLETSMLIGMIIFKFDEKALELDTDARSDFLIVIKITAHACFLLTAIIHLKSSISG